MVTNQQVELYRKALASGRFNREQAAAKAGVCTKTARKWESGLMPSECQRSRSWRTRSDDFAGVWDELVLPELKEDDESVLEAKFLYEYLQETKPSLFPDSKLRTFQRRVRDYRAVEGPAKEVFFAQVKVPGEKAQLDFTRIRELGVTINGHPLEKLLFEAVLCYSGRRFVVLVPSESYEALSWGLQGAFSSWGGVPNQMWHDHMSAAIHPIKSEDRYEIHQQYRERLAHFGVEPRFIEVAKPNQNGCVERAHGVLKSLLRQALKLRRNKDFDTEGAFTAFVDLLVERLNRKRPERWSEDQKALSPLPSSSLPTYSELKTAVSCWSLIQVRNNTYSVPSSLIGHQVCIRLHLDRIEVFYKHTLMMTAPRCLGRGYHVINYRHLIDSLVRKPGAFRSYRYREEMFPSLTFRSAYDALNASSPEKADLEYLRILKLAAHTMESDVEVALVLLLDIGAPFNCAQVQELTGDKSRLVQAPTVSLIAPGLSSFDSLLSEGMVRELAHC